MQFIDVNCMLGEWTNKNLWIREPADLIKEMQRIGIARSLVFASNAWQNDIKSGNSQTIEMIKGYEDSLLPVMVLTPLIRQEFGGRQAVTDYLAENRIAAVRLFPMDHNYSLEPWNNEELFSLLEELQIPVLIDGKCLGGVIDPYYDQIHRLADSFRNLDIVLLTVSYRRLRTIYPLFDRHSNIHIDTSTFITYHGIEDVVKYYGSERLLFGTRMPFIEGAPAVGRIIYAELDAAHKENIAYRNALRLLGRNKCTAG